MEELEGLGVDIDEGLDRVMGDEALYKMMLGIFVDTIKAEPIDIEDFNSGDIEALKHQVHTLKGTTGNLSFSSLFEGYMSTLQNLRDDNITQAKADFEKLLPIQNKIIDCIERHRDEL